MPDVTPDPEAEVLPFKTVDEWGAELRAWNDATPPPGPIHQWPEDTGERHPPTEGQDVGDPVQRCACCGVDARELVADVAGGHSFTNDPELISCRG